ncbi:hypothetical protein IQ07DRAFT_584106 [Pyrenochaeta sp. DS3sAY3a]|nr:hypothetical protein IQ07DRAFT_584106 [Pyrenochaeta sp. DS3sAY3a]
MARARRALQRKLRRWHTERPQATRASHEHGRGSGGGSRNGGLGPRATQHSRGGCALSVRDGDSCSDNRSSSGAKSFSTARGYRRAVAVHEGSG